MRPGLMDSRNRILTDARQPWIAASFQAQTIDGLRIILSAPDPSILVGKVIDYQDGKFQLREP
jgi:hypothetical protein